MAKILKPVIGPENAAWAERIDAALKAGEKPAYSDLEEGLTHLFKENAALKDYTKQSQKLIAKMVVARHHNQTEVLLADLDTFIKTYVTLKTAPPAKKSH